MMSARRSLYKFNIFIIFFIHFLGNKYIILKNAYSFLLWLLTNKAIFDTIETDGIPAKKQAGDPAGYKPVRGKYEHDIIRNMGI